MIVVVVVVVVTVKEPHDDDGVGQDGNYGEERKRISPS